ncbi:MAG: NAD-dependent succinate-semialdehyde dehydrogenase [Lacisediminihabitans sp.]
MFDPPLLAAHSPETDRFIASLPHQLQINGQWCDSTSGKVFGTSDPATGEGLAQVADAGVEDIAQTVECAHSAYKSWSKQSPRTRSNLLRTAYELLVARSEDFAQLITLEMGKPLAESRGEVKYASEFVRWYSEEAVRITGTFRPAPEGTPHHLTMRQGVGACLLVTPWNFPLAMITRKVAPAIAAGCSVVIKPAAETPLTALFFTQILLEAGMPPGLVNVLPTSSASPLVAGMLADTRIRKLSFTGSTEVGRILLSSAAANVQRTSMELGGNAPFLVFADADLEAAIDGAVVAKLRNGGESCVAANRFLVADEVAEEFAQGLAARFEEQVLGNGMNPESTLGPLIDDRQRKKVIRLVEDAVAHGAQCLTGGAEVGASGYFYAPTVLENVASHSPITEQEIFGPVAAIQRFSSEEEALTLANSTNFGLVAFAYTRDLDRALRVSEELETGMVGINRGIVSNAAAPFGGVKHSGIGREGGEAGIGEYLETKYVAL